MAMQRHDPVALQIQGSSYAQTMPLQCKVGPPSLPRMPLVRDIRENRKRTSDKKDPVALRRRARCIAKESPWHCKGLETPLQCQRPPVATPRSARCIAKTRPLQCNGFRQIWEGLKYEKAVGPRLVVSRLPSKQFANFPSYQHQIPCCHLFGILVCHA